LTTDPKFGAQAPELISEQSSTDNRQINLVRSQDSNSTQELINAHARLGAPDGHKQPSSRVQTKPYPCGQHSVSGAAPLRVYASGNPANLGALVGMICHQARPAVLA